METIATICCKSNLLQTPHSQEIKQAGKAFEGDSRDWQTEKGNEFSENDATSLGQQPFH